MTYPQRPELLGLSRTRALWQRNGGTRRASNHVVGQHRPAALALVLGQLISLGSHRAVTGGAVTMRGAPQLCNADWLRTGRPAPTSLRTWSGYCRPVRIGHEGPVPGGRRAVGLTPRLTQTIAKEIADG